MLYFQMRICSSENQPLDKKFEVGPVIASAPTDDENGGNQGLQRRVAGGSRVQYGGTQQCAH